MTRLTLLLTASLIFPLTACSSDDDGGDGAGGSGGAAGAGGAMGGSGGQGGAGGFSTGDGGAGGGGVGGAGGAGGMGGEGGVGGMGGEMACEDLTVYPDEDADGYGVDDGPMDACLMPDEVLEGYARESGDCRAIDPWANPGADEICGDNVDDNCDGRDEDCPTTSANDMDIPEWNCQGDPPANVVAFARFNDGGGFFVPDGCFIFFEGLPGEFYVTRQGLPRANEAPECETINGCTCPSLNGWPSYDRRLYAFTRQDVAQAECEEVSIQDHGGEDQPVSSSCRKYLYQMHFYDIPYSYFAGSLEALERRLDLFPTVEIACAEDRPHMNLPFQSLIETDILRNPGFTPMRP